MTPATMLEDLCSCLRTRNLRGGKTLGLERDHAFLESSVIFDDFLVLDIIFVDVDGHGG